MRTLVLAFAAVSVAAAPVAASADTHRSTTKRHVYRGQKVCRHSKAEAGAVAGGVGGAVAGAALGGGLLGTVAGILIADYLVLRRQRLVLDDLYREQGAYTYRRGVNPLAVAAFVIAILPVVPGFVRAAATPGGTGRSCSSTTSEITRSSNRCNRCNRHSDATPAVSVAA